MAVSPHPVPAGAFFCCFSVTFSYPEKHQKNCSRSDSNTDTDRQQPKHKTLLSVCRRFRRRFLRRIQHKFQFTFRQAWQLQSVAAFLLPEILRLTLLQRIRRVNFHIQRSEALPFPSLWDLAGSWAAA